MSLFSLFFFLLFLFFRNDHIFILFKFVHQIVFGFLLHLLSKWNIVLYFIILQVKQIKLIKDVFSYFLIWIRKSIYDWLDCRGNNRFRFFRFYFFYWFLLLFLLLNNLLYSCSCGNLKGLFFLLGCKRIDLFINLNRVISINYHFLVIKVTYLKRVKNILISMVINRRVLIIVVDKIVSTYERFL